MPVELRQIQSEDLLKAFHLAIKNKKIQTDETNISAA